MSEKNCDGVRQDFIQDYCIGTNTIIIGERDWTQLPWNKRQDNWSIGANYGKVLKDVKGRLIMWLGHLCLNTGAYES